MDNEALLERLLEGASRLGIDLQPGVGEKLVRYLSELDRWNRKVSLTAIVEPLEMVEKHLLDSLAVLPEVEGGSSLLDLGTGAGLPGIPLKIVRPQLRVLLVDSVGKKVGFLKHVLASQGLASGARAEQIHAAGHPGKEKIDLADIVVSRALMDISAWVPLASAYVAPNGRVLALVGKAHDLGQIDALRAAQNFQKASVRSYRLPFSGAERHIIRFDR